MVGAHRGGGVGNADALDCSWFVGWHALPLDHWAAHDAQDVSSSISAVTQDAAQRCPLAHFVHQFDGLLTVAEFGQSGLHGHRDSGASLYGVQAIGVAQSDQFGDFVQVVNAAVSP